MSDFLALDVLNVAERLEQATGAFYRQAVERTTDSGARALFAALARQEDVHRHQFGELRRGLLAAGDGVRAVQSAAPVVRFLRAIAGEFFVDGEVVTAPPLDGTDRLEDLLWRGIRREKDLIVLYLGVLEVMPDEASRGAVNRILGEEQSHLAELTGLLENMPGDETV